MCDFLSLDDITCSQCLSHLHDLGITIIHSCIISYLYSHSISAQTSFMMPVAHDLGSSSHQPFFIIIIQLSRASQTLFLQRLRSHPRHDLTVCDRVAHGAYGHAEHSSWLLRSAENWLRQDRTMLAQKMIDVIEVVIDLINDMKVIVNRSDHTHTPLISTSTSTRSLPVTSRALVGLPYLVVWAWEGEYDWR